MKLLLTLILLLLQSCTENVYDVLLKDLSGREVTLGEFREGPLIVYVWSGTCVGHTEDLKRLTREFGSLSKVARLVTVAIMMDEKEVREVLTKNGINAVYPVLVDPEGEFAKRVTLLFLPATIFFDKRGLPVEIYPGLPKDLVSFVLSHQ